MACADCFQGQIRTDAEPEGEITEVHGLKCYTVYPAENKVPRGIIVIVPDAFGIEFKNNKLLADEYARLGQFLVYLPDFMDGNSAPIWGLESLDSVTKDMSLFGWLTKPYHLAWSLYGFIPFVLRNTLKNTMPRVTTFLAALRRSPQTSGLPIGVAGFCWGGQHVVRLCWDRPEPTPATDPPLASLIDVAFTAHPSLLRIPDDIEKVNKPLCIAAGDLDHLVPIKSIRTAEQVLQRNGVNHKIKIYEGAGHGWSVRIDRSNSKQKEQAEDCERLAINWFETCFRDTGR